MHTFSPEDAQRLMRIKGLLVSEEWKLVKELMDEYAKVVLYSAVNMALKPEFDRDRLVNIAIFKGFQSFIARTESLGQEEVRVEVPPTEATIPDF